MGLMKTIDIFNMIHISANGKIRNLVRPFW